LAKDACVVSCTSGAMDDGQQKDLILADFAWFCGSGKLSRSINGILDGGGFDNLGPHVHTKVNAGAPAVTKRLSHSLKERFGADRPAIFVAHKWHFAVESLEWVIFWEQDTLQHARTCPRHKVISFPTLSILSCVDVFSKCTDLSPQSAVTQHWLGTWPCSEVHFLDCPVSGGPRGAAAGGFHGPMCVYVPWSKDWLLYTNIGGWSSIHYGFIYSL
jgi:hypothetical protein